MLCFDVYWRDIKTGRIELDSLKVVKNVCYLKNSEKNPFIKYPFYYMKTGIQIVEFLKTRVIDRDRGNIEELLAEAGIKEYNYLTLLKKYHGVDVDDFIWFKFDDNPKDKFLHFKDVHPRA